MGRAGSYRTTRFGGEEVRAFVPAMLPPDPPIDLAALALLLERADQALGRLDGISTLLPDPQLFIYFYVRKEAVLSSQIEGTQSSLSDLLLFELDGEGQGQLDDLTEVSSYVAAMEHGLGALQEGQPVSVKLLGELHAKLLHGGRGADKTPGALRRTQNWIGGSRPGNAIFVPPPVDELAPLLANLTAFIQDGRGRLPVAIRTALIHVQFETIHPFLDGNGRLGRLLMTFFLRRGRPSRALIVS